MTMIRRRLLATIASAFALTLALAPLAPGQGAPWIGFDAGSSGGLQPDLLRRDLVTFDEHLHLDRDQAGIVEELFRDYERLVDAGVARARAARKMVQPDPSRDQIGKYREAQQEVREEIARLMKVARSRAEQAGSDYERQRVMSEYEAKMRELREKLKSIRPGADDPEAFRQMRDANVRIAQDWRDEQNTYTADFLGAVQAILSKEQEARWPGLERRLRREKTLPFGELSGEKVDLFVLLREMDVEPAIMQSISEELEAYELRLDDALKKRNVALAETRDELYTAIQDRNPEEATSVLSRQVALRQLVRDANVESAAMIAAALPENLGPEFMMRFNQRAFARVYQPTRVGRLLRSAVDVAGLDDETRGQVAALEAEYQSTIAPVNESIRETVRTHEPTRHEQRFARLAGVESEIAGAPEPDPIEEAYKQRGRIDAGYLDRLRGLLPTDLFNRLPGARIARTNGRGLSDQAWAIEQFDANGDGRLDTEEMAALREHLRQRTAGER